MGTQLGASTMIGRTMSLSVALLFLIRLHPLLPQGSENVEWLTNTLMKFLSMSPRRSLNRAWILQTFQEMKSASQWTLDSSPSTAVPDMIRVTLTGYQQSNALGTPSCAMVKTTPLISVQT